MDEQASLEMLWDETARRLETETGLHFARSQWHDMQRGLSAAAAQLCLPDAAACARRLLARAPDAAERRVLAECLTIGETYFFRDPATWGRIASEVLAPLVHARRQGSRHLRMWSAACATGEEPYTLAMVVASLLPDWRDWDISILATDLNPAALEKAARGLYGPWSSRGGIPDAARPFLKAREGGLLEVDPAIRALVHFAPLNLVEDRHPLFASGTTAMDLVLCRNVLIYFEAARAREVLSRLGGSLAADGWLVTSPVELPAVPIPGFMRVFDGELPALRRSAATPLVAALASGPAATAASASPPPSAPRPIPFTPRRRVATPQPAPAGAAAELARRARAHADAGALPEAEALCRQAIVLDKLNPDSTYLLSSILCEQGALDDAEHVLRRTLYLDPNHVPARFALGTLALRQGRARAGHRHLSLALSRLSACAPEEVIRGSGGLSVGELECVIRRAGGAG